jgi:hypothetical protein
MEAEQSHSRSKKDLNRSEAGLDDKFDILVDTRILPQTSQSFGLPESGNVVLFLDYI